MRMRVVLPAPLLPSSPTISFFSTSNETLSTARTLSNSLLNLETLIMCAHPPDVAPLGPVPIVIYGTTPTGGRPPARQEAPHAPLALFGCLFRRPHAAPGGGT